MMKKYISPILITIYFSGKDAISLSLQDGAQEMSADMAYSFENDYIK